jgi:hypothetical protein
MRIIHCMDIYSLILYPPAIQTAIAAIVVTRLVEADSPTDGYRSSSASSATIIIDVGFTSLAAMVWKILVQTTCILYNFMPSDKDEQKKMLLLHLWLAVVLVPGHHLT